MGSSIHICDIWNSCWYQEKEGKQQMCQCAPRTPRERKADSSRETGEEDWEMRWWDEMEARCISGCKHMNPAVHSLDGSEECMALLGVPFLYKILRVGYWIWEQRTGHCDDLRGKIKEQKKDKLIKSGQLKWKVTALTLESHGTVQWSPVKMRVPWGLGIWPVSPVRLTQVEPSSSQNGR